MGRPELNKEISIKDFNDFYWLKQELVDFCKSVGITTTGGKMEIAERIRNYISTGNVIKNAIKNVKVNSKFDWNSEILTCETVITDNYRNGENVRNFFIKEIGSHFSFNVIFMKWMKVNTGRTLDDAIYEWKRINDLKKDKKYVGEIDPQFEYNRYMRAFLHDNPNLSSKDAMKYWKLKSKNRGTNEYERIDLNSLIHLPNN